MKVLMLAQFFAPTIGGEERVVENLARALVRRGHEVAVATLRVPGLPDVDEAEGVRIHRIGTLVGRARWLFREDDRRHVPPVPDPEALLALRRVVNRERPDVVHAHNWLVHSFLPLKRSSGAALVMSLHDYSLVCATKRLMYRGRTPCPGPGPLRCPACASECYGPAKGIPTTLLNWLGGFVERRTVDMFLPVSSAVAERSGLQASALPFRVVPNFIPDAVPPPSRPDPRLSHLPSGDFLLYVGDLTPDKGVGVLLEAYAALAEAPPLVLIGRRFMEIPAELREKVLALGPWPHAAVLEAWQLCAVAVVPSVCEETFGMVALEGMAAGKPVVASRIGGLAELVADGQAGMLVRPGDSAALRRALERLIPDRSLRERMGRAATTRAEAFGEGRVMPLIEEAYEAALRP
jgi:glycosyltransferase involved in cell wall biosynthesis